MKSTNGKTGKPKGTLIIIGGHEDKGDESEILTEVAKRAKGKRHLVIVTAATTEPREMAQDYMRLFDKLGVTNMDTVNVESRAEAHDEEKVALFARANVIFFTGGDQLRITSQIGDSPLFRCMQDKYVEGATIVGTSAGAAAMSETMLIAGKSDKSHALFSLEMAPGLGLIGGVVIDSHFAERGRIGRLLGAVAQNPRILGLGIDEDTAIIVAPDRTFEVLGSGAVYVVDGAEVTYTNLSEEQREGILTACDVKLHVLSAAARYDLNSRRPVLHNKPLEELRAGETQEDVSAK
jgi:cyanophycinase